MKLSTRKKASANHTRYSAPALEKGLDVLEALAAEPHSLTLQEIANRLDRSPNELFRMLDVLVRRGYLAREPDSTYVLTLRLFELGQRHPLVDRLLDAAMPHMQELARQTGQSNHLCVHHDARLVVLARAEPPEPMSCLVRQGAHFAFLDDRVFGACDHRVPDRSQGGAVYLAELAGGKGFRGAPSDLGQAPDSYSDARLRARAERHAERGGRYLLPDFRPVRCGGGSKRRLSEAARRPRNGAGRAQGAAAYHRSDLTRARLATR